MIKVYPNSDLSILNADFGIKIKREECLLFIILLTWALGWQNVPENTLKLTKILSIGLETKTQLILKLVVSHLSQNLAKSCVLYTFWHSIRFSSNESSSTR